MKSTLLPQSCDDDDARMAKLLAWAKSRHIWIHDDAIIGKMSDVRLNAGSDGSIDVDNSRKRKFRGVDRLEDDHVQKRQAQQDLTSESYPAGQHTAQQLVENGHGSDTDEESIEVDIETAKDEHDERARGRGFGVYIKPSGRILERQVGEF